MYKMQPITSRNNCIYSLKYYLVLKVYNNNLIVTNELETLLKSILDSIISKWHCQLISFSKDNDIVYLAISITPDVILPKLVNSIKTVSSRLMRKHLSTEMAIEHEPFWTDKYYIQTLGHFSKSKVQKLL